MTLKFAATVEQAGDGSWTAAIINDEQITLGTGDTREAALLDLQRGVEGLCEYLKSQGIPLPRLDMEVVSIEIAA